MILIRFSMWCLLTVPGAFLNSYSFSQSSWSPFPISRISQNNRISYYRHVIPRLSVVLVQLLHRPFNMHDYVTRPKFTTKPRLH